MKKLFLGLTGNIGSGKTTVLNLFKQRNFKCLNADEMVHEMFASTHPQYKNIAIKINEFFGISFINQDKIDRKILRTHIQKIEGSLKLMSDIISHFITQEIINSKDSEQDTIIEVPLLFEGNMKDVFDKSILVFCNDEERKRRIKIRNPDYNSQYIQFVMDSQMKQQDKIELADYIIHNEDNKNLDEQINLIIYNVKKQFIIKKT